MAVDTATCVIALELSLVSKSVQILNIESERQLGHYWLMNSKSRKTFVKSLTNPQLVGKGRKYYNPS
jgi:hypothetical protein